MNKIIFKIVSWTLCSVVAISAQQAEQNSLQFLTEQQPQQPQQPQSQVQQPPQPQVPQELQPPPPPLPPQPQVQQFQPQLQVQQPLPSQPQVLPQPQPQLQYQMWEPQQTDCPKPLAQTKIGLQARFSLNDVSYGFNSEKNDKIDMGIGFGGGLIRRIPITNSLDVNPEIGFFHRNLFSEKSKGTDYESGIGYEYWDDETEFVLSLIPVLAQLTPFEVPFYVAAGFQVDFPILAKLTTTKKFQDGRPEEESTKKYERAGYDLGVVWGLGYNVTERFSFNFRSVVGLRSITGTRIDARTPTQYGLGVTFF